MLRICYQHSDQNSSVTLGLNLEWWFRYNEAKGIISPVLDTTAMRYHSHTIWEEYQVV